MSAIAQLVQRARRRRLIHGVLQQAAVACALGLGTSVLLLITGTSLLDHPRMPAPWVWPLLLFAVSFAILSRRARPAGASDYRIAQEIDRRLALHDSLSTALYFEHNPAGPSGFSEVIACQRHHAEQQAHSADLSRAIPFIAPRALYVCGWLALMAAGLFAARYGITRTLDLRASLVHLAFHGEQATFTPGQTADSAARDRMSRKKEAGVVDAGLSAQALSPDATGSNALLESLQTSSQPGQSSPGELQVGSGDAPGGAAGQDGSSGPQTDSAPVADGPQRLSEGAPGKATTSNGSPSQAGAQQGAGQEEHSSLLDRMREAMAGLLSKLSAPQNSGDNKSSSPRDASRASASNRNNAQGAGANGKPQENSLSSGGRADPSGTVSRGMKAIRSSDQQSAADSSDSPTGKSGIGRQDGRKDPRLAEQLAAMGKISEIIGRRSRTITGDVVVEVTSGVEQPLKTAYSGRQSAHSDTTGEISRDEVPLIYQD